MARTKIGFSFAVAVVLIFTASIKAQAQQTAPRIPPTSSVATNHSTCPKQFAEHPFWDRTNLFLFSGVTAVRVLDYTSTRHFRGLGRQEILLSNDVVDDKPLFAGIEAAGVALSIGVSYWLHRTGHHKLERLVSVAHIGVGAFGDVRNYRLKPD